MRGLDGDGHIDTNRSMRPNEGVHFGRHCHKVAPAAQDSGAGFHAVRPDLQGSTCLLSKGLPSFVRLTASICRWQLGEGCRLGHEEQRKLRVPEDLSPGLGLISVSRFANMQPATACRGHTESLWPLAPHVGRSAMR